MLRMMKNYRVFCGPVYRWIMWLLYPLAVLALEYWSISSLSSVWPKEFLELSITLAFLASIGPCIVIFAELFMELYFLRGVGIHKISGLAYIQTSQYGMSMLKNAVCVDLGRKTLMIILSNIPMYLLLREQLKLDVVMVLSYIAADSMILLFALMLSQLIDMIGSNFIFGALGMFGIFLAHLGIVMYGSEILLFFLLLIGLRVLLFYRNTIYKKGRACYYDNM